MSHRTLRADRGAHASDARVPKDGPTIPRAYDHKWRTSIPKSTHETPEYASRNRSLFSAAVEYKRYKEQQKRVVKTDV